MTAAETRVAVLLALMRQLQEVMRTENGLLRDLKLTRLHELQLEKSTLAGHYELELRRLRQTPDALAGLGEEARRMLEGSMREFQATVRANADRLLQARSVVEAVVQAIGHSLAAAGGPSPRYAAGPQPPSDPSARVIPVAFDRRC
jgi:hypothetical protein